MTSLAQRSFAGGELAPSLWARTDQSKYATGARTLRNFLVRRHGGVANRPGTELVGETKDSGAAKLVPFVYSPDPDQVYVLEFGDRYLRVHHDGGQVVVSGVAAWVTGTDYTTGDLVSSGGVNYYAILDHTAGASSEPATGADWATYWHALTGSIYEMPTPYAAADLADLRFVQSGDVVTLVHPSYKPRNLSRTAHTRWVLEVIDFGATIQAPTNLVLGGGAAGSNTYYYAVTALDGDTESAPAFASIGSMTDLASLAATPITLAWDPVPNADRYNVYRSTDGVTYGKIALAGGTASDSSDNTWGTATSTASTAVAGNAVLAGAPAVNQIFTLATEKAANGDYAVTFDLTLAMSTLTAGGAARCIAYYQRDAETPVAYGTIAEILAAGTQTFTETVAVPDNGYASLEIHLYAEVQSEMADAPTTWDATVTGAEVAWTRGATETGDTGTTADLTVTPPTQAVSFNATGRYPSAVGYSQQRRFFASTDNEPEKVWGSRIDDYANFGLSVPLQADDAVSFSLVGNQVNEVQWLLDLERLLVATTGGIFRIDGDESGAITPSTINPRKIGYNGSADLPPIPMTNTALYVQARGSVVRDIRLDAQGGHGDRDLSIFAAHLFNGYSLTSWAHQAIPDSIVWAVRSDGALLGLTYLTDHEVWGWHRHETAGWVEDVVAVPEGTEDRVYLIVRRTIDGQTKRFVERMGSRTITALTDPRDLVFMDSALTYDGRNTGAETMTLTGSAWDGSVAITVTRSVGGFIAGDVGNAIFFYDEDGALLLRVVLEGYTSGTVMTGRPQSTVPASLQGVATTAWARAVETLAGLDHLEGESLAVVGDAAVVASPYNPEDYPDAVTVSGGQIVLDQPYAVVHAGLPYLADLETLDIDTASGPSMKAGRLNVTKVHVFVEDSRGFWAGPEDPGDDDPLDGLDQAQLRDAEDDYDVTALKTDTYTVGLQSEWNSHGRVFLRNPDPVPLAVLAVIPDGHLPAPR